MVNAASSGGQRRARPDRDLLQPVQRQGVHGAALEPGHGLGHAHGVEDRLLGRLGSGDIFIAFSTSNRIPSSEPGGPLTPVAVEMLPADAMSRLFLAAAEATEEAILNAMCMAETMTGLEGRTVHALPLDRLREVMTRARAACSAAAAFPWANCSAPM